MTKVLPFHCVLGLRCGMLADPDLPEHDRASSETMWEWVLSPSWSGPAARLDWRGRPTGGCWPTTPATRSLPTRALPGSPWSCAGTRRGASCSATLTAGACRTSRRTRALGMAADRVRLVRGDGVRPWAARSNSLPGRRPRGRSRTWTPTGPWSGAPTAGPRWTCSRGRRGGGPGVCCGTASTPGATGRVAGSLARGARRERLARGGVLARRGPLGGGLRPGGGLDAAS